MVNLLGLALWVDFSLFLVMLGLLLYVFIRNTITPLHKVYLVFHGLMMLWPLSQFAIATTAEPLFQAFYLKLSFISLSLVGEGWLIFTIFLTGQSYELNRRSFLFLSIPAALAVAAILFNPGGAFVRPVDGFYIDREYGGLFWFMAAVSFGYVGLSLHLLFRTLRSSAAPRHRRQVRMALTGILILSAFALADLTVNVILADHLPIMRGIISVGILLSDIYFVVAIMRLKVFEIVRIAETNVIDSMSTGIVVVDEYDVILEINAVMRRLLDIRVGDRLDIERFLAPYEAEDDTRPFIEAYRSRPPRPADIEIVLGDERFRHTKVHVSPIFDRRGHLLGRVLSFQNVSDLRLLVEAFSKQNELLQERNRALVVMKDELFEANMKLEQMAVTDALTGCFNRRYIMQQLEHEVLTNLRYGIPFAIFLFDIDMFKGINDTYGHLVGDEVLRSTAEVVRNSLRRTDILARYGGEEFMVYLPHTNREQADMLASRIKLAVEYNNVAATGDAPVSITISIGVIAVEPSQAQSIDDPKAYLRDLFGRADTALYGAKNGGRNAIVSVGLD